MANPELQIIKGMNSIVKFEVGIRVTNNPNLNTIKAFNNLREAGKLLDLNNNGFLPNFNFLSKLKKENGNFTLLLNHPTSLSGLDSLTRVENNFEIFPKNKTFNGLENLNYVGNSLYIVSDS